MLVSLALAAFLIAPNGAQAQDFDDLNGIWTVTLDGKAQSGDALTESFEELNGVRMRLPGGQPVVLNHTGNTLWLAKNAATNPPANNGTNTTNNTTKVPTDAVVNLTIKNVDAKDPTDDSLEGTWYGKKAVFKRDTAPKAPIVTEFPGNMPYTVYLRDVFIPLTGQDRESYHKFDKKTGGAFLKSCQLYKSGYWTFQYFKNGAAFTSLINDMDGVVVSPRRILKTSFSQLLQKELSSKGKSKVGLAMSSMGMYYSTAAGGAVRIKVADDSTIYYITDKRASSTMGLVVMDVPDHPPLASSFGRWQQSFSQMPYSDDPYFARTILETMVNADTSSAKKLSGIGRSAFTDYLGVMMIEDQRGVMFEGFGQWGYNMTSGSFCALIARALSHGQMRTGPTHVGGVAPEGHDVKNPAQELATQVIVQDWNSTTPQLRPGDITYFDTLNGADDIITTSGKSGGGDFSEGEGMTLLLELTTQWLRDKHADQFTRVRDSLKKVIPASENDSADIKNIDNIFHFMCDNFYDEQLRMKNLTASDKKEVLAASEALIATIYKESKDLEAYILAHGVTKSTDWAPRASGY